MEQQLTWITDEEIAALAKGKKLDVIEVEDCETPGAMLEAIVTPPTETAWAAAMRFMTNSKDNANDAIKMQQTLYSFCFVKADPELAKQQLQDDLSIRYMVAIGKIIGELYPFPEARLKKRLRTL